MVALLFITTALFTPRLERNGGNSGGSQGPALPWESCHGTGSPPTSASGAEHVRPALPSGTSWQNRSPPAVASRPRLPPAPSPPRLTLLPEQGSWQGTDKQQALPLCTKYRAALCLFIFSIKYACCIYIYTCVYRHTHIHTGCTGDGLGSAQLSVGRGWQSTKPWKASKIDK